MPSEPLPAVAQPPLPPESPPVPPSTTKEATVEAVSTNNHDHDHDHDHEREHEHDDDDDEDDDDEEEEEEVAAEEGQGEDMNPSTTPAAEEQVTPTQPPLPDEAPPPTATGVHQGQDPNWTAVWDPKSVVPNNTHPFLCAVRVVGTHQMERFLYPQLASLLLSSHRHGCHPMDEPIRDFRAGQFSTPSINLHSTPDSTHSRSFHHQHNNNDIFNSSRRRPLDFQHQLSRHRSRPSFPRS